MEGPQCANIRLYQASPIIQTRLKSSLIIKELGVYRLIARGSRWVQLCRNLHDHLCWCITDKQIFHDNLWSLLYAAVMRQYTIYAFLYQCHDFTTWSQNCAPHEHRIAIRGSFDSPIAVPQDLRHMIVISVHACTMTSCKKHDTLPHAMKLQKRFTCMADVSRWCFLELRILRLWAYSALNKLKEKIAMESWM